MGSSVANNDSKVVAVNGVVGEYEVDDSWRNYKSTEYWDYREKFEWLAKNKPLGSGLTKTPLNIEIESTYHCNLRCPYCPRTADPDSKHHKHMNLDVWDAIVEQIKNSDTKAMMMDHEGEALLNPRLMSMISEARDAGVIDIWLHSNANLLTPKKSKELIEAGIDKLNISIDAVTEETYSKVRPGGKLYRVEENLRNFLEIKKEMNRPDIRVRVSFVYCEMNAHERDEFIEKWREHVNVVAVQSMIDMSVFENPIKYLHQKEPLISDKNYLGNFTCDNVWTVPVIDTDGFLAACGMPIRPSTRDDLVIGNILETPLNELWHSDKLNELRKSHKRHDFECQKTCEACALNLKSTQEIQAALI